MTRLAVLLTPIWLLAACENPAGTAAAGAAAGALIDDDEPVRGALIGGATAAIAQDVLQRTRDGNCLYRDPQTGGTYTAACP